MSEVVARLHASTTRGRRWGLLLAAVAAALALVAVLTHGSSARAAGPSVAVFPVPGAQVAAPQTQITFRGIPASQIGSVTVTGSVSGVHGGVVKPDSDGNGGSFIPTTPFTPGETVTVSTGLSILGTGSAGTGPASSYTFTVAHPAGGFPNLHWPPAGRIANDVQRFRSRPDLQPVSIKITRRGATQSGDIFLAPQWGPVQDGPMILDPNGNLIWFDRMLGNNSVSDFRVQTYHGQQVLTWWQGHLDAGIGIGQDIIFDDTYRRIATVDAGNGLSADLHEFQLTPQGTALITADYPVWWTVGSGRSAKQRIVLDSVVQEIDIPTGLVLFQWDSLDHVPLSYTYVTPPARLGSPFDPYHINSIALDHDGNLLISMRNTWAIYKVNHQTGQIMWTLGGRRSSFRLAPGTYWAFQHDVRVRAHNDEYITMFDDDAGPPKVHSQSRAIKLRLDLTHMTAKQVTSHTLSPPVSSNYEGNYQQLPDGDDFVGWGQQPFFSEYNSRGNLVFEGQMVDGNASYRVYRFPWTAVPWTLPAIAPVTGSHNQMTVYVSWNGATTVAYWRLLGGPSPTSLQTLTTWRRRAFETGLTAAATAYVQVQALDANHNLIKSSIVAAVR